MTAGMKKHLIILILKLLESESDKEHPLTQTKIADLIADVYACDRKTVGRNIGFLTAMGYPIVKTPRGFFLDRKEFSVEETRFVEQAIRSAPDDGGIDKERLLLKLLPAMRRIGR